MKHKAFIFLVLAALLFTGFGGQAANAGGAVPEAEKYFPFGTSIGWGNIDGLASRQGLEKWEWVEAAFDDMQAHHINTLHLYNLNFQELDQFVSLAQPRGIRIYAQAGGLPYYFPTWIESKEERENIVETQMKPAYADLIDRYGDSSGILAWSICEETPASLAPELKVLTDYIDGLDSNHPAVVCYNQVASVEAARDVIEPRVIPIDLYPFFADPQSGPTTPSASLSYYENKIHDSYQAAKTCGAPLWVVAQGMSLYKRPDETWVWRYPTPNEMRLQAWAAIVNGAKGIMYWVYSSTPADNPAGETIYGLVDRDGNPTEIWDAVGNIWFELEPLTKIIVDIDESSSSIVSSSGEGIRARTFQRETGTDRYVIVVNTNAVNSKTTGVTLTTSANIYDLTALEQVTPDQLLNHVLLPGGGNIYLVGSESDFDYYLDNYEG